ncbi:MAG: hypothetical protein KKB34_18075 [Bacteroidetes bacterium]|nr:hypothetical protein [Bacteroidota bacterium]
MRLFEKPIIVEIPTKKIYLAKEFANAVVKTVNYNDCDQYKRTKIENDHFISKLGEEAVYLVFSKYTTDIIKPDYTIYVGDYKSWSPDLTINKMPLAVKTQKTSTSKKYGLSWTFQFSKTRKDPLLLKSEQWVCFVECDDLNNFLSKVFPPVQIKQLQFREPVLQYLKGKKKVIYYSDLKNCVEGIQ